jgi:hypothetical protein
MDVKPLYLFDRSRSFINKDFYLKVKDTSVQELLRTSRVSIVIQILG